MRGRGIEKDMAGWRVGEIRSRGSSSRISENAVCKEGVKSFRGPRFKI